DDVEQHRIKGLGFRGEVMGRMIFGGIKAGKYDQMVRTESVEAATKEERLYIGEQCLEKEKFYEVATLDMFTLGKLFPSLQEKVSQYFLPEMLRDLLAWKLQQWQESPAIS